MKTKITASSSTLAQLMSDLSAIDKSDADAEKMLHLYIALHIKVYLEAHPAAHLAFDSGALPLSCLVLRGIHELLDYDSALTASSKLPAVSAFIALTAGSSSK